MLDLPRLGDRVRITGHIDDPDPLPLGSEGFVDFVNTGIYAQVGIKLDNGRRLMLLPDDPFEVVGRRWS